MIDVPNHLKLILEESEKKGHSLGHSQSSDILRFKSEKQ